ncbi:MBL fold metallo-hydrolase [Blastopirellula sp. JC732]|uniref:MBL fold metallo-hydrolase n=1 Tax=Blastopirellula sediminis TaxID=2894196 RepID=A0A9X1MKE9_9BACT|nr:MBL fold metallo-hydrolase [Blastopirellula sediminis]MCC9608460.1 MBL fold metallo-hydrolase [Blastopirellula sediminis]MCC9628763.1 MBL fold metallo-hydrolase [Blastopirellula sediminis]
MSIRYEVLGPPGRDNALMVTVNSGHGLHRLLFDCGDGVFSTISIADLQLIEGLFFSHFHFDHIAGFDTFFRMNWGRTDAPVRIFGPSDTREIVHHRLQGVTWNLVSEIPGEFRVTCLDGERLITTGYKTCEGFRIERLIGSEDFDGVIYRTETFEVAAMPLPHGTVSMGYVVRELPRQNVDLSVLKELGLKPGAWLKAVKDEARPDAEIIDTTIGPKSLGELRSKLLVTHSGESIAYLTDFWLDSEETEDRLLKMLAGCRVMVCENNYADAELELARKNYHMTSSEVGRLAAKVQPEELIVFHVSDRYTPPELLAQLSEVQQHFPKATFPAAWMEAISQR